MEKANDYLTDVSISKIANALFVLFFYVIESPDVLPKELQKDELFKKNVYSVEKSKPYINPLTGNAP